MNIIKILSLGSCLLFITACTQTTPQPINAPSATPSLKPSPTHTSTPQAVETESPSVDQELLTEEWRIPIENAIVLFSACTFMFDTHVYYQQSKIDLAVAQEKLSLAADFLVIAEWFSPESYRSETSAALMLELELTMRALIEWYDATGEEDIGTQETLDALFPICETAQTLQTDVVFTAMEAGLYEESVDEIDRDLCESEIYRYYSDQLQYRE